MATACAATTRTSTCACTSACATASVVSPSVISASVGFLFGALVMGIYMTVCMYMISVPYEETASSVIRNHTVEKICLKYENKCRD